jgi:hypothetical protein
MRTPAYADRDRRAAEMWAEGETFETIAAELDYGHRGHAHRAVKRLFAGIDDEGREMMIRRHQEALDLLTRTVITVMRTDHYVVSDGRVVKGEDGLPLIDDGPVLHAVNTQIRVLDRYARLMGLDAPKRVEHTEAASTDLDKAVQELVTELSARADGAPVPPE